MLLRLGVSVGFIPQQAYFRPLQRSPGPQTAVTIAFRTRLSVKTWDIEHFQILVRRCAASRTCSQLTSFIGADTAAAAAAVA